tara:strand:+ start:10690 stop:11163 length:474 start_codon:yes stop_codon:yes gene_type:complete
MENEFDVAGEESPGAKQMRETIERKDKELKVAEAKIASYEQKELDSVFGEIGLTTDKGFGKALKQVYDGPIEKEAIAQFAKDEYGFEASGINQEIPQTEEVPVAQDDARARVAALDANSKSEVPTDVMEQLEKIVATGDPKASIAARLSLLEQEKNK